MERIMRVSIHDEGAMLLQSNTRALCCVNYVLDYREVHKSIMCELQPMNLPSISQKIE
jgi:hypothetical protein